MKIMIDVDDNLMKWKVLRKVAHRKEGVKRAKVGR